MLAYHILLLCILNVTVIYLCIYFHLAPVEGFVLQTETSNKNVFYILILFLTLLLAVRISLL